jgi:2-succinyl-5-enolpyruvyl-6-hydroxy-3-cyclohexene-1-carboxylate synthase
VLVAGRQERDPGLGETLGGFARRARVPLLADPLSGARRGPAAVAHYDALLRDPEWAGSHTPDLVIRVGDLPTSKPLRAWLHGLDDALQVALGAEGAWQDPAGAVATILDADARTVLAALDEVRCDPAWLELWQQADRAAGEAIATTLGDGLSEPRVAAELVARLPPEATLVVASSMPVRDVETFAPARTNPPRVLANRGANGIDGTVSTAFGVAAASDGPVVLLIGDVALAHDIGGLLAASRTDAKLTIVLLHNDGGGIFDFLPVAATEPHDRYVRHVATPHGLDFSHAASLYGCDYTLAGHLEAFRAALDGTLDADRTTIVAVHTDRGANVALHRAVTEAVAASLR